jgi:hypothetical protein
VKSYGRAPKNLRKCYKEELQRKSSKGRASKEKLKGRALK